MKKIILGLTIMAGAIWLLSPSWADEPAVCPPGCIGGAVHRECPPGMIPGGVTWCSSPHRECETIRDPLPSASAIRALIIEQSKTQEVPPAAQPYVDDALLWPGRALEDGFYGLVAAARCHSGGEAGPADPAAVPDAQVKAWLMEVLERRSPEGRTLRPLVASLPEGFIAGAWRAAVRLKRSAAGGGS